MHLKTHFKVLINSSKISKTGAHIIFLLNTRHDQEPNKIRTTSFGSIKLELPIFEMVHQNCEKQLNKTNKETISLMLGRPEETAAHEYALAWPKTLRSPHWAPA